MKLLFDFLPILLFFIAFKLKGIYFATAIIMVATLLQVIYTKITKNKIETIHIVTLGMILVLGGATIFLENEMFIKWKVTAVNWIFSLIFVGSHFIGKKTVIERLMSKSITLPTLIWKRLNASWACFFAMLGTLNLYVIYNYDTNTWVNFKLFGVLGITILFVIIQSLFMAKHVNK